MTENLKYLFIWYYLRLIYCLSDIIRLDYLLILWWFIFTFFCYLALKFLQLLSVISHRIIWSQLSRNQGAVDHSGIQSPECTPAQGGRGAQQLAARHARNGSFLPHPRPRVPAREPGSCPPAGHRGFTDLRVLARSSQSQRRPEDAPRILPASRRTASTPHLTCNSPRVPGSEEDAQPGYHRNDVDSVTARERGQKSPQLVPLPVPGSRCCRKVARCGRALGEGVLWSRARPRSPLQPWRPPPRPGSKGSPKWPRWAARGLVGGGRGRGWLGLGGGRDGRRVVPRARRPSLSGGRGQGGPDGRGGHPRVSVVVVLEGVYLGEERGSAQTRLTRHLLGAGAPGRAG